MLDDTHTADKIMHGIFRAEQTLKEMPTVDAVPGVRCKDCTFHNEINCPQYYRRNELPDDWFCADGERRSDEQD